MRLATKCAVYPLYAFLGLQGGVAFAQAESATPAPTQSASASVSEVVVTGSRIARRDLVADSPILTVGAQLQKQDSGAVTIDQALVQLPEFVAGTGPNTNNSSSGGEANLDLRGLGRQRTLVLLDGRRVSPSNSDGSVDINVIPDALIENVEVITGGASATYGSDAVAGVVNFKLKHHFEGEEVDVSGGETGHGDAANEEVSLLLGRNFNDGAGNFVLSLGYTNRDPVFNTERAFTYGSNRATALPDGYVAFPTANAPSQAAVNALFATYGVPANTVNRYSNYGFNTDGTLFSDGRGVYNYKGLNGVDGYYVSPTTVYDDTNAFRYLQLPFTRYNLFTRAEDKLTSDITGFIQLGYTHYTSAAQTQPTPDEGSFAFNVPVTNPFIPSSLASLLASRANPTATFPVSERFDSLGARNYASTYDDIQATAGLNGTVPFRDWTWSTFVSYGRNDYTLEEKGAQSISATNTLLDAADGGNSLCAGGLNLFGGATVSPACVAYITRVTHNQTIVSQGNAEGDLNGSLFTLPAGEVKFALGVDYRIDRYTYSPDDEVAAGDISIAAGSPLAGSTNVSELYGELLVPIVNNVFLIKSLDADLGYRFSDYSTSGGVNTYKATGNWEIVPNLRLRGGYERAIRAPSVGELFTPTTLGSVNFGAAGNIGSGDPCDVNGAYRKGANAAQVTALCAALGVPAAILSTYSTSTQVVITDISGNRNLQPETADTYSLGVTWRLPFEQPLFRRIQGSVDYYNISVANAIGTLPALTALYDCFNATGTNPTYSASNVYCQNIQRSTATGNISTITQDTFNLGNYKTSGIDFQLQWTIPLDGLGLPPNSGSFETSLVGSYLERYSIQSLPGAPTLNYAGTIGENAIDSNALSHPRYKAILSGTYTLGPGSIGARLRYISAMQSYANVGVTTATPAPGVDSVSYVDLFGNYNVTPKIELWANLTNLADKQPPFFPSVGLTDPSTYDVLGRAFMMGLRARF